MPEKLDLYVDLDGTLLKTDLLVESAFRLLARNPLFLFGMLGWLLRGGKARLKAEISQRVSLNPDLLPYSQSFLEWLRLQAAQGRRLVLASASARVYVDAVARHLGLFSSVLASDRATNLAGANKLAAIQQQGGGPFSYAGNARPDLAVWRHAASAVVVNGSASLGRQAAHLTSVEASFNDVQSGPRVWLRAIRIHQWLKNLLVGVPLLTSFRLFDPSAVLLSIGAFVAFGLVASATYLINDLVDLDSDRLHPRKRKRPLAAGDVNILHALLVCAGMLSAGLILALLISPALLAVVLVYLVSTLGYSFALKRYMLLDVLCLAGLYTWRIVAGAVAIEVDVSNWLLAFSGFVFLSLALVKRCAELVSLAEEGKASAKGRDYRVVDLQVFVPLGAAAGCISVLVLALFIDSSSTAAMYKHPRLLWLLCPVMLYGISRLWVKTVRGEMHDDPIIYSARDRASWLLVAALGAIALAAH